MNVHDFIMSIGLLLKMNKEEENLLIDLSKNKDEETLSRIYQFLDFNEEMQFDDLIRLLRLDSLD